MAKKKKKRGPVRQRLALRELHASLGRPCRDAPAPVLSLLSFPSPSGHTADPRTHAQQIKMDRSLTIWSLLLNSYSTAAAYTHIQNNKLFRARLLEPQCNLNHRVGMYIDHTLAFSLCSHI